MADFRKTDPSIDALARRNLSTVLAAMPEIKQVEMARLLGVVPSVVSDYKEDDLKRAMQFLASAGLKVVPKGERTVSKEEIAAYEFFVRKSMLRDDEPVTQPGDL